MKNVLAFLVFLLGTASLLAAPQVASLPQEEPPDPKPLATRVAELKAEFDQAMQNFMSLYREAKTDAEKEKLLREKYPEPETFAARFQALAESAPADPEAAECWIWVIERGPPNASSLEKAMEGLSAHHADRQDLGSICETLTRYPSPKAEHFLRSLLEKSPHVEVRGKACHALASYLSQQASFLRLLKTTKDEVLADQLRSVAGEEALQSIMAKDATALEGEAEKLLERVVSEFGDLEHWRGSLGKAAKADLFELRNLSLGKAAPEITGEDVEGVRFSLSDYRGKVVVLDFWGHW